MILTLHKAGKMNIDQMPPIVFKSLKTHRLLFNQNRRYSVEIFERMGSKVD